LPATQIDRHSSTGVGRPVAGHVMEPAILAGSGKEVRRTTGGGPPAPRHAANGDQVVPVEVKAGENTKAKSMRTYREKYAPEKAILFSGRGINQLDHGLLHAPLYLAGALSKSP
jgi:hypothetical protein